MKKHLLALAALATMSGLAAAQTATVYGIVDLSVSKVTNTVNTSSKTGLTDAVWMPSVFGITGSEDLGGGLKATFNLESDVNMDTGALSGASGASSFVFGRKSNVGLSGNFGSFQAGKDIDIIFLQGFIDNVRNSHSSSGFVAHALASGSSTLNTETVFVKDMIKYTTPVFNGFKATLQHKFGEAAGNTQTSKSDAYLVSYSGIAGLNLNYGFKVMYDSSNAKTNLTYIGGTYQLGQLRLAASTHETKYKSASTATIRTNEIGAAYALTPALTAAVNYVDIAQGSAKGDITSGSLKYAMSKRTSLWTLVSKRNYDGFNIGAANYGMAAADGQDSSSYSVGITHSF
jgi:predicted porin